ncbi:ribonuclease Z [Paenibacillus sp. N1-5-1-14]|uniref:ribonuclease Z n=1 Tax=Paenibacillus radicibacter TaxID=2972488 RepID=UPI00215901D3|nr:ribonuclease Z [Paenibacillus radicibacter]MCR8641591.1 ribonuclease Z [Paenibacillus radicibacter]
MELYFLGTGAGMPSKERNVTAIALSLLAERGTYWLFDCGEGTQHQVLRTPVKLSKLEKIFITHLHGDHIFGLPGLLSSRSHHGGDTPLTIYGPRGIEAYVRQSLAISGSHLNYELMITELDNEGIIIEDETFTVEMKRLDHRIECFGYRIIERDLPGPLLIDKLRQERIPSGPIYGQIKQGGIVTLPDGREINGADYIGATIQGRIITILGDTKPCANSLELAKGADVLVHEATFDAQKSDLARDYDHSTSVEAATTARDAGARVLIMTHISARYQEDGAKQLINEAQEIHSNVHLAEDFWVYAVRR